jgi:hypothetical protein
VNFSMIFEPRSYIVQNVLSFMSGPAQQLVGSKENSILRAGAVGGWTRRGHRRSKAPLKLMMGATDGAAAAF